MQDRRDPAHVSTYIAEAGKTLEKDGESYLQLTKGVLLRPQSAGDSAIVTFDDYTIDLSQFMQAVSSIKRPRERSTAQLWAPNDKDRADPVLAGHIRSELLDRLASPLYALVAGLIAFAALGEARTTRQGRGLAIGGAILAFVGVRILGIAATTLTVGVPSAAYFVWGDPGRRQPRRAGDDLPAGAWLDPGLAPSGEAAHDRANAFVLPGRSLRPHRDRVCFPGSFSSSMSWTLWRCCGVPGDAPKATAPPHDAVSPSSERQPWPSRPFPSPSCSVR